MIKTLKTALILFFVLTISTLSFADEAPKHYALGFAAGPTYGGGITFRYVEEKLGFQVTGFPFYANDSALLVGGVTGFYVLNRGKYGQLYTSLGVGCLSRKIQNWEPATYDPANGAMLTPPVQLPSSWTTSVGTGPGIGFQFNFAENFSVNLELPIAVIFTKNSQASGISFERIAPWPNGSLLYNF